MIVFDFPSPSPARAAPRPAGGEGQRGRAVGVGAGRTFPLPTVGGEELLRGGGRENLVAVEGKVPAVNLGRRGEDPAVGPQVPVWPVRRPGPVEKRLQIFRAV